MKRAPVYTMRIWSADGQELGTVCSDQALEILKFGHSLKPEVRRVVEFLPAPPAEGRLLDWPEFVRIHAGQTPAKAQ